MLALSLVPFAWFAARDQLLHFTIRRVSITENVIHALLALLLTMVIALGALFRVRSFAFALLAFVACGAVDEYVFHRGIPAAEHDVHAKEHFALLLFVAVFGVLAYAFTPR